MQEAEFERKRQEQEAEFKRERQVQKAEFELDQLNLQLMRERHERKFQQRLVESRLLAELKEAVADETAVEIAVSHDSKNPSSSPKTVSTFNCDHPEISTRSMRAIADAQDAKSTTAQKCCYQ